MTKKRDTLLAATRQREVDPTIPYVVEHPHTGQRGMLSFHHSNFKHDTTHQMRLQIMPDGDYEGAFPEVWGRAMADQIDHEGWDLLTFGDLLLICPYPTHVDAREIVED